MYLVFQVALCLLILAVSAFMLGWTAREIKPVFVSCFNGACSSAPVTTDGETFSKDVELGKLVIAKDSVYGHYIGYITGLVHNNSSRVRVTIMACIKYPIQTALIFHSKAVERDPYSYHAIHSFDAWDIEPYEGEIPDYYLSVGKALGEALEDAKKSNDINLIVRLKRKGVDMKC